MEWCPFSEKQLDFIRNSDARLNIADGAVRAGKTIACNVRWLDYIVTGPPGDLALFGKTRDTLYRNVLTTLFEIVGKKNWRWVNKQSGEMIMLGRRCYCFGASNEEAESKIRGATFAGALCDEANLYPQNVFKQLLARCSVPNSKIFLNMNPDSPMHWMYREYLINDEIRSKKRWQFLMEDNLSLSPEYIADLKSEYSGVWYDRMIRGLWVAAEGRIYDMFDSKTHMVDTYKMLPSRLSSQWNTITWIVGCDYGTSTVMSWGLYAMLIDGTILKVREYYYDAAKERKQKTDAEFAEDFVRWLDGLYPQTVYCDPSAASWKATLRQLGFIVRNADNDVINGIRHVSTKLKTGKYFIDRSCVNTEREYGSYVWDKHYQELGIDKPVKENDHACDTDRYALYTESLHSMTGRY